MDPNNIKFTVDIQRSQKEIVRISLDEPTPGRQFINIRTWVKDEEGMLIPTQKGVYLPADKFDELFSALDGLSTHITRSWSKK